ncbi:hypothetical protein CAP48_04035 [Advenella sp. S44]|uniref:hypothetical protein n=1 Tax=Advenella sp. S44 TaxID=1982755 RepID=UPI000C2ACFB2|nr:hypothetical protein [Advenella sp. S44]PJX25242.1 hypothetical protein CAP48_04035 [Advenella sp. S44]
MKNVFASLVLGAAFIGGAAHASGFSESQYHFPENAVSPVQQNLIVEQSDTNDTSYPAILVRSTDSRANVQRDLAAYRAEHPADEYLGD